MVIVQSLNFQKETMMIDIINGQAMDKYTKNELMESFLITPIDLISKSFNEALIEKGYNIPLTNPVKHLNDLGVKSIFRFV